MSFKHSAEHRHRISKPRYRVTSWREYDAALRRRGSLTVWFMDEATRRNLKMATSAHAYVRGNTLKFYEWLEAGDRKLPHGPPVWIRGDCHLGNLGPLADLDGRVDIQIRDLDQTVIGNPAHDLVRLGLSLVVAARGSDLPGVTTAHIIEEMTAGYIHGLEHPGRPVSVDDPMPAWAAARRMPAPHLRRSERFPGTSHATGMPAGRDRAR